MRTDTYVTTHPVVDVDQVVTCIPILNKSEKQYVSNPNRDKLHTNESALPRQHLLVVATSDIKLAFCTVMWNFQNNTNTQRCCICNALSSKEYLSEP